MKIRLGGRGLRAAGVVFQHAIEAVQELEEPRAYTRDQEQLVRARFRTMIAGTRTLTRELLAAIDAERHEFLARAPVREAARRAREADSEEPSLRAFLDAVDAMGPARIERALRDAYQTMYEKGVRHVVAELGPSFDLHPDRALAALEQNAVAFSVDVIVAEKGALKELIHDAFERGIDPRELARDISNFFEDGIHRTDTLTMDLDSWAQLVARTEIARAQNAGAVDGYLKAGVGELVWITADDERVCPICNALDGATTKTGELFPGTLVAHPPEHPQCRCGVVGLSDLTRSLVKAAA